MDAEFYLGLLYSPVMRIIQIGSLIKHINTSKLYTAVVIQFPNKKHIFKSSLFNILCIEDMSQEGVTPGPHQFNSIPAHNILNNHLISTDVPNTHYQKLIDIAPVIALWAMTQLSNSVMKFKSSLAQVCTTSII